MSEYGGKNTGYGTISNYDVSVSKMKNEISPGEPETPQDLARTE